MFSNPQNRSRDCCYFQSNEEFTWKNQVKRYSKSDICALRKYNGDNKENQCQRFYRTDSYEFNPRDMYQSKRNGSRMVTDYNADFCNFDRDRSYENVNHQRTVNSYEDICKSLEKLKFGEKSSRRRKYNLTKQDQPTCCRCTCKTCPFCFLRIFCVEVLKELAEIKARQLCSELEKLYYVPQAYEGEQLRSSENSFGQRRRRTDSDKTGDGKMDPSSELSVDTIKDRHRRRDPGQKDDPEKLRHKRKSGVVDTQDTRDSRRKTKGRLSEIAGVSPEGGRKSRGRQLESIADNINTGRKSQGRMGEDIVDGGGDGPYINDMGRKSELAKDLEMQGLSPEEIEKRLQRASRLTTKGRKKLVEPQTQSSSTNDIAEKKKKKEEQVKKELAAKRVSQATQMANKHWAVKHYTGPGRFAEITICDFMKLRLESIIEREMAMKNAGPLPPCSSLLFRPCMPVVCTISPQYCCPSFWCPPPTAPAIC